MKKSPSECVFDSILPIVSCDMDKKKKKCCKKFKKKGYACKKCPKF